MIKTIGNPETGTDSEGPCIRKDNFPMSLQDVLSVENTDSSYLAWIWHEDTCRVEFGAPQLSEKQVMYEVLGETIQAVVRTMNLEQAATRVEEVQLESFGKTPQWFLIRCRKMAATELRAACIMGTARDITSQKSEQLVRETKLNFIDALMDSLACPVFFKDENLVYRHCNRAFETYIGLTRDEILGKSVYDISPPEMAAIYHASDVKLIEGRKPQIYEAQVKGAGGQLMDVMFHKAVVFNKQDEPEGIVGIIYDITDRVRTEKLLSRALDVKDAIVEISHSIMSVETIEELYNAILNRIVAAMPMADSGCFLMFTSPDILSVVSGNGIFAGAAEPIIVPIDSCVGCHAMNGNADHCFTVNHIKDYARQNGFTLSSILDSGEIQSTLYAPITSKGILSGFLAVGSKQDEAFDDSDVVIMEYVRTQLIQVLEKQHLYEKNTYLAKHDGLTGLLNRKYFEDLFETSKIQAQLYQEKFHLILIDLDRFKSINDTYGHHVGDAVLIDFSRKLRQCFRESDIVARFGGDEFIVLLKNTTASDLEHRLESFRSRLWELPVETGGHTLNYSFSYGICEFPSEGVELDRLIRLVDYNLYVYKRFKDDHPSVIEEPAIL